MTGIAIIDYQIFRNKIKVTNRQKFGRQKAEDRAWIMGHGAWRKGGKVIG
jgi:hypothetical protein